MKSTPSHERICLLTGGGYPYRRDALSGWCRTLVEGLRRFRFDLLTVTDREPPSAPAYPLPLNVGSARALQIGRDSGRDRRRGDHNEAGRGAAALLCRGLLDGAGFAAGLRGLAELAGERPDPLAAVPLADLLVDAWRGVHRGRRRPAAAPARRPRRPDRRHPAAARARRAGRAASGGRPGALRRRDHAAARRAGRPLAGRHPAAAHRGPGAGDPAQAARGPALPRGARGAAPVPGRGGPHRVRGGRPDRPAQRVPPRLGAAARRARRPASSRCRPGWTRRNTRAPPS